MSLFAFLCFGIVSASHLRARHGTPTATNSSQPISMVNSSEVCQLPEDWKDLVEFGALSLFQSLEHALSAAESDMDYGLAMYNCKTHKKLVFLHIPKNAGTTIEFSGQGAGVLWGKLSMEGKQRIGPGSQECTKWHIPPGRIKGPNPYHGNDVFCVVRDPYERAVSEYKYLLEMDWNDVVSGMYRGKKCTPNGLNFFLTHNFDRVNKGLRFLLDCHMLPQYEYIYGDNGYKWCRHVLRTENLAPEFNQLMLEYGINARMSEKKENSHAETCPALSTADISDLNRDLMRKIYAKDFQFLGYKS